MSARVCHRPGREPEPRLFSFNNPFGACPRCQGFGNTVDFDLNLVIPDPGLTLQGGAIDPWNRPKYRPWFSELRKRAAELGVPLDVPWREMPDAARETVLRGKDGFAGVMGFFAQMERKKYKLHVRVMLSKYRGYAECPDCRGQRLRAEARAVRSELRGWQEHLPGGGADDCAGQGVLRRAQAFADAGGDCRADSDRGAAAAEFSGRRGAGISDAGPAGVDA